MIELLYTTLVLFGIFLPMFFVFSYFKYMKLIMVIFQLILSIILLSNNFYKKHSLYNNPKVNYIQNINDFPINFLYEITDENYIFVNISYDTMKDKEFSLIKTENFPNQCLEHYYIRKNETCPITDIELEKMKNNEYQNYIKIRDDEYLYFTKENKLGKIYKSFNLSDFEENKEDIINIDEIIRKEYNKLSNPFIDFKFYIKFCDIICITLIFISLWYSFFELIDKYECNPHFEFSNDIIQILILILYLIRFVKFIEIKNFLFDNEDIYKNDSYFPNKVFNIDSFSIALSINLFIFNLLESFFLHKITFCSIKEYFFQPFDDTNRHGIIILFLYMFPLLIVNIIAVIFDFINDSKIFEAYDNLFFKWKMNPLKSIRLLNMEEVYSSFDNITIKEKNHYIFWGNHLFYVEKMENFDYINIITNNKGKICGKDNYGNKLYFPENVECPINKIIVSDNEMNLPNFTKLYLNDNKSLYYSNQFINEKIIVDLKLGNISDISMLDKRSDSYFLNIPIYEKFDYDFDNNNLYLFNYLGINMSSFSEKQVNTINDLEYNIKNFKYFSIAKIVLFSLEIFIYIFVMTFIGCYYENDLFYFIFIIFFL